MIKDVCHWMSGVRRPECSNGGGVMAKRGYDCLPTFMEVQVILPFFEKKWTKNAIKSDFLGPNFKKFSHFRQNFSKCRNFKNSCRIWSSLMYNVVLKRKIGSGAEGSAKIARKCLLGKFDP